MSFLPEIFSTGQAKSAVSTSCAFTLCRAGMLPCASPQAYCRFCHRAAYFRYLSMILQKSKVAK